MRADKSPQVFGSSSDPTVTERLPHIFLSGSCIGPLFHTFCLLTAFAFWKRGRGMFRQRIQRR